MDFIKKILDILYPKRCCFCGEISHAEKCPDCAKKVIYIKEPRCKKCGRPVRYDEQEYCYECQKQSHFYIQGKSIWLHKNPVNTSIYQFKYHNRRIFGEYYAHEMYRLFKKDITSWKIDVIIPVPLHKKRRRKRGYNQAEIIAKELGKISEIPVDCRFVYRKKSTKAQKELDAKERRCNLKDAFEVVDMRYKGKNILLIDDIYTTGSTIDTVAETILIKMKCNIWFLTISIGQDF